MTLQHVCLLLTPYLQLSRCPPLQRMLSLRQVRKNTGNDDILSVNVFHHPLSKINDILLRLSKKHDIMLQEKLLCEPLHLRHLLAGVLESVQRRVLLLSVLVEGEV